MAVNIVCSKLLLSGILILNIFSVVKCRPQDATDLTDPSEEFYKEVRQLLAIKLSNNHDEIIDAEGSREYDAEHSQGPPRPKEVTNWPNTPLKVGQITAVSVNTKGQPVIFHRGQRVWDEHTFNGTEHYQPINEGPIAEDTILTLDPTTGAVLLGWGGGMFYMPHGLTVDRHEAVWVTDVGLHQVFKFVPDAEFPTITLGVRFHPGSSRFHLCKPTSVAVATSGEVFVADGYCNNRVLKFSADGELQRVIPQPPEFLSLQVPHSVTLMEHLDLLCIADRENMRVTCPRAGLHKSSGHVIRDLDLGAPAVTIHQPDLGRVFAVAAHGDIVYAVNGPTSPMIPVRGFTIDPRTETIIDHWSPTDGFNNPHSVAICPNGSALYVAEIGPNRLWKFNLFIENEFVEHK